MYVFLITYIKYQKKQIYNFINMFFLTFLRFCSQCIKDIYMSTDFSIELSEEDKKQLQQFSIPLEHRNRSNYNRSQNLEVTVNGNQKTTQKQSQSPPQIKKEFPQDLEACFIQNIIAQQNTSSYPIKKSEKQTKDQKTVQNKISLTRNVQYPSYFDQQQKKIDEQSDKTDEENKNMNNVQNFLEQKKLSIVSYQNNKQIQKFKIQLLQTEKQKKKQERKINRSKSRSSPRIQSKLLKKIIKKQLEKPTTPITIPTRTVSKKIQPLSKTKQKIIELKPQKIRITLLNINRTIPSNPIKKQRKQISQIAPPTTENILVHLKKYIEKKVKKKFQIMLPTQEIICRKRQSDITTYLLQEKEPILTEEGCVKQQMSIAFSYEAHNPAKCQNCNKYKRVKPNNQISNGKF